MQNSSSSINHRPVHGWLSIHKPAAVTSTHIVSQLRFLLNIKKIGHAGTLDPFATGVLPLAIGEATKTISYLQDSQKTYLLSIRFGEERDTDDCNGNITAQSENRPTLADLAAILPDFQGNILQTPPPFSAIKVNGKRAYAMARAGVDFTLKPRFITIDKLTLHGKDKNGDILLEVRSGKGAYMRVLARDLARKLGCYAHLAALERTKCGIFTYENSFSLDFVEKMMHTAGINAILRPLQIVLAGIPALYVTTQQATTLKYGNGIVASECRFLVYPYNQIMTDGDFLDHVVYLVMTGSQEALVPVGFAIYRQGNILPKRIFNIKTNDTEM